jgi:hypothetical protein
MKASVVAKRRRPSAPANSSTSLRSRSFTTSPRLSASKSRSISAWLIGCLKAMHKGRRCHLKISARAILFAQICGQRLVVDLCSQQRNHPVENPQLKADTGELAVAGQQRGNEFYIAQLRYRPFSAVTSSRKNSRSFPRSPSTVKLLPVENTSCTAAFEAISPTLSAFCRTWLTGGRTLRVQSEVPHERAQPLGINVRVARRCCDALMA